jgi:hypothetical protein
MLLIFSSVKTYATHMLITCSTVKTEEVKAVFLTLMLFAFASVKT